MGIDAEINVVGKACPLPLISLAKAVRAGQKGQIIRITGNDPIFEESVAEFCRSGSHEILETKREGKTVSMVIKI